MGLIGTYTNKWTWRLANEHYVCVKERRWLQDKHRILESWQQYFSEISEFLHPLIPDGLPNAGPVPHIFLSGPDYLPADIWKLEEFSGKTANRLTNFLNAIVDSGHITADWVTSIIVPFFKNKGDPTDCSNYQSIHLQRF